MPTSLERQGKTDMARGLGDLLEGEGVKAEMVQLKYVWKNARNARTIAGGVPR
ncbi:MAG: hypothetical protein N3G20_05865 [Verrucomicrobiae bacterium]|nr:hypothetical protein [Verrucomicrobiae bacterium]